MNVGLEHLLVFQDRSGSGVSEVGAVGSVGIEVRAVWVVNQLSDVDPCCHEHSSEKSKGRSLIKVQIKCTYRTCLYLYM